MALHSPARASLGPPSRWAALALFAVLSLGIALPSWAFLGLLSKVGKIAKVGKAASAGKGGAAAGAAVLGTDALEGAAAANRVLPSSAEALSKASGLGKAVPDEVAAMLKTPGKTLHDVPDPMVSRWLSTPPQAQTLADANGMMIDVDRLAKGQKALGKKSPLTMPPADKAPKPPSSSALPWYAVELTLRAAHLGHRVAMLNRVDICRDVRQPETLRTSAECRTAMTDPLPSGG